MNEQQKAEAYVREKLPELMELSFGCACSYEGRNCTYLGLDEYPAGHIGTVQVPMLMDGLRELFNPGLMPRNIKYEHPWTEADVRTAFVKKGIEIIGHPIQLQHWLRVLSEGGREYSLEDDGELRFWDGFGFNDNPILFDLTTGQPATEADYKAFNDIVGV